jgi:hypothetical protein
MDDLIEGLEKLFGPMIRKPDDMPLGDFFKMMRKLNTPTLDMKSIEQYWPYINGTIWEGRGRAILTYLGDEWALLGFGRHRAGGGVCVLNAHHWMDSKHIFAFEELPERLKDWKCLGLWEGIEYPEVVKGSESAKACDE